MRSLKYPNGFINEILCGDCLKIMKQLPDEGVDLVVTSPPYNLKNSTGNGMKDGRGGKWSSAALIHGYSHYNDNMPHDKYVKWQRECLEEMMRVIPNDGAIFYNHIVGSGTTALAAKNHERKFIGIDISPEYCEMSIRRIENPSS